MNEKEVIEMEVEELTIEEVEELDLDNLNDGDDDDDSLLSVSDLNVSNTLGKEKKNGEYLYPFQMYFGHQYRDISYMFEKGKWYKEKEITKILIDHGFKEFKVASVIEYEFFENENCLFPKFKIGNRG